MPNRAFVAVEDTRKRGCLVWVFPRSRSNDGLIEDLATRQTRVQVDVGRQNEMLVVVSRVLTQAEQVLGCGDLVGIPCRTATATVLGVGGVSQKTHRQNGK